MQYGGHFVSASRMNRYWFQMLLSNIVSYSFDHFQIIIGDVFVLSADYDVMLPAIIMAVTSWIMMQVDKMCFTLDTTDCFRILFVYTVLLYWSFNSLNPGRCGNNCNSLPLSDAYGITRPQWVKSYSKSVVFRYRPVSNISRNLVGNEIVDHSDIVGASPVDAAPTTSSFST